jgi:hypothetical protein
MCRLKWLAVKEDDMKQEQVNWLVKKISALNGRTSDEESVPQVKDTIYRLFVNNNNNNPIVEVFRKGEASSEKYSFQTNGDYHCGGMYSIWTTLYEKELEKEFGKIGKSKSLKWKNLGTMSGLTQLV